MRYAGPKPRHPDRDGRNELTGRSSLTSARRGSGHARAQMQRARPDAGVGTTWESGRDRNPERQRDLLITELRPRIQQQRVAQIGASRLRELEDGLVRLASTSTARLGHFPGWLRWQRVAGMDSASRADQRSDDEHSRLGTVRAQALPLLGRFVRKICEQP
jgi:hypothetical protein